MITNNSIRLTPRTSVTEHEDSTMKNITISTDDNETEFTRRLPQMASAGFLLAALSACGESDLEQLQRDAIVAAQENVPVAGPANPGTNDPDQNNDNDQNNNDQNDNDQDNDTGSTPLPITGSEDDVQRNTIDLSGYELVFNENFDTSAINNNKWNTAYKWGTDLIVNNEEQYYIDILNNPQFGYNPFRLDGDTLAIGANTTPSDLVELANDQPYVSGVLTSADKFNFTHGYVEMRAQLPAGAGLWPQLWMLPQEFVGLKPQTFIMEMKGQEPASIYHSYKWQNENDELQVSELFKTTGDDFSAGFHTYGLEWNAGELIYYVDGAEYQRFTSSNVASQDMYLIVNLAVGGWFVGSPDESTQFPVEMLIDHIRVYQKAE